MDTRTTTASKRWLCLVLTCTLGICLTQAQTQDLNFINFSTRDGLSSNCVNAILKDRYGYMWFATGDGLNKFDGVTFTVYRNRAGDTTTIGGNIIMALFEDKSGNLWVGTNQSISFYDRKKDAFINYKVIDNSPARAIWVDHQGNVWAGSYVGLYKFNPRTGLAKHYSAEPGMPDRLQSNTVVTIFEDTRKRLWVGTSEGLHLYIEQTDRFTIYRHAATDPGSIADNTVRHVTEDFNGNVWFGTHGGLSKLQPDGKTFKNYRSSITDINTLSGGRVDVSVPDNAGRLWIGTENGLSILDLSSDKILRVKTDPRNKYSFCGKAIRSAYLDKSGIFWFGTNNSGVNKYDQNLAFFNFRQSNPLDPYGLTSSVVTSFAENPSGDIYIGTDGGGLHLYRRQTGLFEHLKLAGPNEKEPLLILAMEKVGDELWVGTYQQGLYILNIVSGVVRKHMKGNGSNDISGNEVFCIRKDSRGDVWIGTNGDGIDLYETKTKTFHKLNKSCADARYKLPLNGFIRTVEEDRFGNIWIGSHGTGIAVYNSMSKTFQLLNHENSELPTNLVLNLYRDNKGNIWAGTSGGGLCTFDEKTKKFVSYSEAEGLFNNIVYKVLEDNSGKLWVSTNAGLSSFDKHKRSFKNYSAQNGLQKSSFNVGAGLKTSNGELFFGGVNGFNYFNPSTLACNKNVPSLIFTDLKVSNRSVIPGNDAIIKEHISMAKEIRLDFKQNFSLDFAALNYTSPQENRYSYKLEGFDREWNHVGTSHTAVYTNLDPGSYTFRVKANSDDGSWSTKEISVKIIVTPPLWRTPYAYACYILVLGLLLALMRYRGIRKLKSKFALEQERLQARQMIEQERRDAERQHEFDELRIKFLTNLSHEFRTPISLIAGPVDKMLQQESNGQHREQLNMVQRNTRRLLNLVNQLLDFRKLEESESKLNLTEGDIISFIRDVTDSFKDVSEHRHIHFSFSSSVNELYTTFDRDKIERILFNLLSNAFKFTDKGGEISLKIEQHSEPGLKITIADTGVGMSPDVQAKVFDRFFQAHTLPGKLNQGSGIGLSITNEFVKLHQGSIQVQSEPGKGSSFTVSLPFKHLEKPSNQGMLCVPAVNESMPCHPPKNSNVIPDAEKLTVLLIEDNDDFRSYLKENLQSYYKIVEAANGKEGWKKALSAHPRIIVSDVTMPGMDGITLCRKLKSDKRTKHIPIILLTALTGNSNQLRGLQTGASDYLTKPFSFEILQVKIKNLLELNQSLKETYTRQLKVATPDVKIESEDEKLLLKITEYIEENLDSPTLTVEELSRHVFMSRGSLYSKIVSLTGETPVEFIRSIKLNKAAALLESSDMKIAQIGYVVGFATPNYFTRAFKAKFNVSPSEYLALKKNANSLV